jgi:hypothetical protein
VNESKYRHRARRSRRNAHQLRCFDLAMTTALRCGVSWMRLSLDTARDIKSACPTLPTSGRFGRPVCRVCICLGGSPSMIIQSRLGQAFRFVSFRFVSFRFVSFRFWFHFVPFRFGLLDDLCHGVGTGLLIRKQAPMMVGDLNNRVGQVVVYRVVSTRLSSAD